MRTRIPAAFAATLAALVLGACDGATEPGSSDYESLPADNILMGVDHAVTVDGVRRSLLRSDTTLVFNDSAMVHLRGVNLEIYADDGQLRATLTSLAGALNQATNRMIARGNVVLVVRGEQGRTVWTEELHYDPAQKRIWSDVLTRTRTDRGEELTGDGFSSDEEFRNFQIQRPRGEGLRIEF
jgi:LPS export ABC transporter protein LptC